MDKHYIDNRLHEYLAGSRRTVDTGISSREEFAHVVALTMTQEDWSQALARSLRSEGRIPVPCGIRRAVAKQRERHDVVMGLAWTMSERLGERSPVSLAESREGPQPAPVGALV